ncbi:uncharacterized protein LOC112085469 [Eutrema salsugineum]|uniref:uncharacterized protein LOC112085469 n=1 Tax=Eutrema salsugineum TaxID=72664 RepID=UPI000CED3673|nr:uncharacterized protein LOC112085469 [Eutrema salsugineum]
MRGLLNLVGARGIIDMGISAASTVEEAILNHRRRRHRQEIYNLVENELAKVKQSYQVNKEDVFFWRSKGDNYKRFFSTKATRDHLRTSSPELPWTKGVWFKYHTPKFAFITWLALHNRLSTGDRMSAWNQNIATKCVFCAEPMETRRHLFFECSFTGNLWAKVAAGIMERNFSKQWTDIVSFISDLGNNKMRTFILRYVFQLTIYVTWRERNSRRHGAPASTMAHLAKHIDKVMRNRFNSIRKLGNSRYEDGMQMWFISQANS